MEDINVETSDIILLRWREREIDRLKAQLATKQTKIEDQAAYITQLLKELAQVGEHNIGRLKAQLAAQEVKIAEQEAHIAHLLKNLSQVRELDNKKADILQQRIDVLEMVGRIRENSGTDTHIASNSQLPRHSSEFDVFLSYCREDGNKARVIVETLTRSGIRVWWDDTKLRIGERFDDYISWALNDALKVIVLWSKHSIHSRYVYSEARIGYLMNKLLPVRIDDVNPPEFCTALHFVDLSGWNGLDSNSKSFQHLIDDIKFFVKLAGGGLN